MNKINVNGKEIIIKVHEFEGNQTSEQYMKQIYSALNKIGVNEKFITIESNEEFSKLTWTINNKKLEFTCSSQKEERLNLGSISQAIQEDVRQIKRGIKDLNLVMKQYEKEEENKSKNQKKGILSYSQELEQDALNSIKNTQNISITSTTQAKMIISEIKLKYKNYSDYSLLPEKDRDLLRKAYLYIGVMVKF